MKLPDTETFKVLPELLHRMVQIQDIYFLLHLFRVGCKSVGGVGGGGGLGGVSCWNELLPYMAVGLVCLACRRCGRRAAGL